MDSRYTLYARLVLRYLSGFLIGAGVFPDDLGQEIALDPQLIALLAEGINWSIVLIGAAIGTVTEYVYSLAKRFGWAT